MTTVPDLLQILDLEALEQNLFRGKSPQVGWQRVFGGLVISQALVAASRTVSAWHPHSLHAYFLLPGDPEVPIIYEVDRIRDGGSFATRRVKAIQHGAAIFSLSASFHKPEPGLDHQMPMPPVPMPDDSAGQGTIGQDVLEKLPPLVRRYWETQRAIELRPTDFSRYVSGRTHPPGQDIWFRSKSPLPDEPSVHFAFLAYASDMTLLDSTLIAHGKSVFDIDIQAASVDHAMWFHRPFRADDWLLYAQDSPSTSGALGLGRGLIYDRNGVLIASVAQEGLIRPRPDRLRREPSA